MLLSNNSDLYVEFNVVENCESDWAVLIKQEPLSERLLLYCVVESN